MNTIRIAIDPELHPFGPEIHWTWRTVLTSLGWAWIDTPLSDPCDLAYTARPERAPQARLVMRADLAQWEAGAALRFSRAARSQPLTYPLFAGEVEPAAVVHRSCARVECWRDLAFAVYWLAAGFEEKAWPQDKHGFVDFRGSPLHDEQVFDQALGSQIALWLKATLLELGCPPPIPRWPEGKRAAAAASHDVDYPEVVRWLEPVRVVRRLGTGSLRPAMEVASGQRTHWHFQSWVELERSLGIRSAFYFVARCGSLWEYAFGTPDSFYDLTQPQYRELLPRLLEAGWEVGLHASYRAHESEEQFGAEKRLVEAIAGQTIAGNRHHYWHLDPRQPEDTLWLHERIGLRYDASLFNNNHLGWRRGLSEPYFPWHPRLRREIQTVQLPTAWMDDQLFNLRAFNPGDRLERLRALIARAAANEGLFVVDIHDYVFDAELFPGWLNTYRWAWEYIRDRGDFWCATPAEVAEHWRARAAALRRSSQGLEVPKSAPTLAA
jgi:hypothetical protein